MAKDAVDELGKLITESKNEEVKRKAIMNVLEMVGLNNSDGGLYGWGIGPKTAKKIAAEEITVENPLLAGLMGQHIFLK